ncbi:hypothetical protein OIU85_009735 [Salix viminalis]|uniref:Uncharacterized protein n=1 Tax=Salix viminalis TaxID=40686 RepID=A0A9Q0NV21_SALVM|nr:hypothetical protein OIU85_009735 [Salix viminalis]
MKGKDWSFYKACNSNNDKGQNRKTLSFPNQTRRSSIFSQKPYHSPTRTLLSQPHLWEKKCEASRNQGAALGNDGSRGDLQFENNSLDNVNLNISNGVMPLQYYTIEYQISNTDFSALAGIANILFHYNRAPDLGNGQLCQVYQGERPVNGVSSLGGSHNKPKVSLMALQLAGVILVPSLTPQTAGGNVHAGALPRLKQLKKIN